MGIVINNSILLVDEGNQLRAFTPSENLAEIAIRADTNRFMPIVLTSLTGIFGLLPIAYCLLPIAAGAWQLNVQRPRCCRYRWLNNVDFPDFALCAGVVFIVDLKTEGC
jgi:hypothetical protein